MTFKDDNKDFEAWLRQQCCVDEKALDLKHDKMSKSEFAFLRATYFRWAKTIEELCPKLRDAPKVLAVGDTHIENFGTWRDDEGHLVWGINDFDEAARMPYAFDLVRLVVSARLAPDMNLSGKEIAQAVLDGYRRGIRRRRPTLLDEDERWMRDFVGTTDEERADFWKEVDDYPTARKMPGSVRRILERSYPDRRARSERFATRMKGGGSLGRRRYVAIAEWNGGKIVREAKALVPSAWDWAHRRENSSSQFFKAIKSATLSPDPYLHAGKHFIVRRLAADSSKIELKDLKKEALQARLFSAMGSDLGSFHASKRGDAKTIAKDLGRRRSGWLDDAADHAKEAVRSDYKKWMGR